MAVGCSILFSWGSRALRYPLPHRKLEDGRGWGIHDLCKNFPLWLASVSLGALCLEKLHFPCSSVGKESACNAGDVVRFLGQKDPLERKW